MLTFVVFRGVCLRNEDMSQYIVSARKYRPVSFATLIGQDVIAQTLKNSIARNQLAHAYLFCGPRGVGKTSAARIFAKTINCSNLGPDMEPCGHCESCVSFNEGRSYCIHELDAASNNGVDDIKALMDQVQVPPQVGKYSVFIIDEVHMLTASAFNAFLKTLEEPPAHAIFILATTEKHKILPTILSRCQTYDFNRIGIPDMVKNLRMIAGKEGITIDDESLHVIARKADGAMRDALTIFDQTVAFCGTDVHYEDVIRNLNVLDYENCFALVEDFLRGDPSAALLKFDEILSKGFNALYFVSALSTHFRDLMVCRSGGADSLLEYPDSLKRKYYEQAARCPLQFLYEGLGVTTQTESGYKAAVNPRLHIEFALMRLCYMAGKFAAVPQGVTTGAPAQATVVAPVNAPAGAPVAAVDKPETSGTQSVAVEAPVSQPQAAPVSADVSAQGPVAPAEQPPVVAPVVQEPIVQYQSNPNAESVAQSSDVQAQSLPSAQPSAAPAPVSAPVDSTAPAPASIAPAPAVQQVAEAPKIRRKATKSASSLSLSSIQNDEKKEAAKSDVPEKNVGAIPEDELVIQRWKQFPVEYAGRPRLAATLAHTDIELTLKDNMKYLTFFVVNDNQRDWLMQNILAELENKMRRALGTTRLKLEIGVKEGEKKEAPIYLPQDKAADLMKTNEEVRNLIVDLSLETK